MNSDQSAVTESKCQPLLGQLNADEAALRAARAHIVRALTHSREAYIAINEAQRTRDVDQWDLFKDARLSHQCRQPPPPVVAAKPIWA